MVCSRLFKAEGKPEAELSLSGPVQLIQIIRQPVYGFDRVNHVILNIGKKY